MENNKDLENAIFYQICEVNEIDPVIILDQAREQVASGSEEEKSVETLIRAAFDYRAETLLQDIEDTNGPIKLLYKVDSDPAAPSFSVNEAYIRTTFSGEEADKIIDALGQVKLPVQA